MTPRYNAGGIQQHLVTQQLPIPTRVGQAHCTLVSIIVGLFQATVWLPCAVRRFVPKVDVYIFPPLDASSLYPASTLLTGFLLPNQLYRQYHHSCLHNCSQLCFVLRTICEELGSVYNGHKHGDEARSSRLQPRIFSLPPFITCNTDLSIPPLQFSLMPCHFEIHPIGQTNLAVWFCCNCSTSCSINIPT